MCALQDSFNISLSGSDPVTGGGAGGDHPSGAGGGAVRASSSSSSSGRPSKKPLDPVPVPTPPGQLPPTLETVLCTSGSGPLGGRAADWSAKVRAIVRF